MILKSEFDLITIFASILSVVAAFFLVRSIILTGSKHIAAMSGTYIGSNPHLEAALVEQKADSIIGFILSFLSGLCWVLTVFYSYILSSSQSALLITLGSTIVIGILSHVISKKIFLIMKLKVSATSFTNHVSSYLQPHCVSDFNTQNLIADASNYGLDKLLNSNLDAHENIAKILRYAGANPGADHILALRDKELNKK